MKLRHMIAVPGLLLACLGAAAADESRVQLAPGAGKDLVAANCVMCHSLDYIRMNSPFLDEKGWTATMNKMVKVMGAPIKEEDQKAIIAYLVAQYGKK
ncbi:MAG: c-type cytochrome [Thiomonas sp.]|uniref:c-type cytochrome n=1 Tax=Thiomonas sp. X19 TaxID=1050370 RepID=UPI000B6EE22A|nr:cytochrome c [Thiomonas sp. X19]SCC91772.1 Sulfite:cytochrome c oxidoreductase subunit B [Thiomonas sp. X19]